MNNEVLLLQLRGVDGTLTKSYLTMQNIAWTQRIPFIISFKLYTIYWYMLIDLWQSVEETGIADDIHACFVRSTFFFPSNTKRNCI